MRSKHDVRGAAWQTYKEVKKLWDTTKIPCIKDLKIVEKIEGLYREWRVIKRHSDNPNPTVSAQNKRLAFQKSLDALFDMSKKDSVTFFDTMIKNAKDLSATRAWEEEKLFFLDQKGPRLGKIGSSIDNKMRLSDQKKREREERKIQKLLEEDSRRRSDEAKRKISGKLLISITLIHVVRRGLSLFM
jgi:hypothetical protein